MHRNPELKFERLPYTERLARFGRAALNCFVRSLPGKVTVPGLPVCRAESIQRYLFLQEIAELESHANDPWQHSREP